MDIYVGDNKQIHPGGSTNHLHQKLFDTVFRIMNTESILLMILLMLYSFGYEFQHKSHLLVYSSRLGRRVNGYKLAASFLAGTINFVMIYMSTLLFFFSKYNFSGLWNSNVSSQFNHIFDAGIVKPFITWTNFKLYQYFLCMILLSFLLVIVFGLIAAVVGNYIQNTYIGVLVMILFCFVLLTISSICGNHEWYIFYFIFQNSPTSLWLSQNLWLTELGTATIIPWQECIAMVLQLVIMGGCCIYSMQQFKRRDLLI